MKNLRLPFLFFIPAALILSACSSEEKPVRERKTELGQMITGDFDGDGKTDTAQLVYTEPADPETPESERLEFGWELHFPDNKFPTLAVHNKSAFIVNEGDLDNKPGDEISLAGEPLNGCSYYWQIFGFRNQNWEQVTDGKIVTFSCDHKIDSAMQAERVVREGNDVYMLLADPNDETGTLKKNKLTIR